MAALLARHPQSIVLCAFVSAIIVFAILERVRPAAPLRRSRVHRWSVSLCLFLLGVALRPGALAAAIAHRTETRASTLGVILGVLLLDLVAWARHAAWHRVPLFWRFHRVHHVDADLDWSTALRFHPIEAVLDATIDWAIVVAFSLDARTVLVFLGLNAVVGVFHHANVRLPMRALRVLGLLFVTPDLHRTHHSPSLAAAESNYGLILSIWDRLFRTLHPGSAPDRPVGLEQFQEERWVRLSDALVMPLAAEKRDPT